MATTHSLQELAGAVVRHRWLILIPFALGVAAAPFLARSVSLRYRSEALIVVMPQQVPDTYVKPSRNQSLEERLPSITEQIFSRSKLEQIILDMNLYKAERARNVMEDVVDGMRRDIQTGAVGKDVDSFRIRIGYVSDNAEKAQKVAERLARLYLDQDHQDREVLAASTTVFLEAQVADAKQRLTDLDKKLEDYRKRHAGQLPTQLQGNLQAIQNHVMQLQALNEATSRALQSRLVIARQLADAEAVPDVPASSAAPPPPVGAVVDAAAPLTPAQQLAADRARRAFLLQRYTPNLPEVVRLNQSIAELEAQLERESPLSVTAGETPLTPAQIAQQKRVRELKAELAGIDYQLDANRNEEARLKKAINEYQSKVDAVPTRESELAGLTRDYATQQTSYENLLMKSEDSKIAANLQRGQIGEQFKLVDQASRPERPYNSGQRLKLMAAGPIGGLLLGLLVVGLVELRDSSFKRVEDVAQALSLPVLASIPVMRSDRERRALTWRLRVMDALGSVMLVAAIAVLVVYRQ